LSRAKDRVLPSAELTLDYEQRGARVTVVEPLRGRSGWLRLEHVELSSLEIEDGLLLGGLTDDGQPLDRETCEKLLTVPATVGSEVQVPAAAQEALGAALAGQLAGLVGDHQRRNERFFDAESDKLDRWADDLKENLERELKDLEAEIREAKKAKRLAADLPGKLAAQKLVNELEQRRNHKKRTLYEAQDQVEAQKDALIAQVEGCLQQRVSRRDVFTVRWRLT